MIELESLYGLTTICQSVDVAYPHQIFRDRFADLISKIKEARFDTHDRVAADLVYEKGYRGLLAAKSSQLDEAVICFSEAESLGICVRGREASLLVQSLLLAQRSYYLYRQNEFRNAIRDLKYSFSNDLALENDAAYSFLKIHRIQLLHNLIRIAARSGNWNYSIALGKALLDYLEMPNEEFLNELDPPWNRGWNGGFYDLSVELISSMHAQIAEEVLKILECVASEPERNAEIISVLSTLAPSRDRNIGSQADLWTIFETAWTNGGAPDAIVSAATPILQHGPSPSAPLWRSVAVRTLGMLEVMAGEFPSP